MMLFDRRQILCATAAGIAFGLSRPLEIIPSALAQAATNPLNPANQKFAKFKVGDIEVTNVFDGGLFREHKAGFVKNASIDDIKASLRAAKMPDAKVPNTYTVTIVKVGGRTVMFDAGNGAGRGPNVGLLAANMKEAGIEMSSLNAIVVTHFHPDHIFGLYGKDNTPLHPSIEIVVPSTEYGFWADPAVMSKLPKARQGIAKRVQAAMPNWKNIRQIASGTEVLPGIKAIATHGHSPGHTSYLITGGSGRMMVLGDVTSIPPINMRNPGWHIIFDQDAKMAEATRRRTFDQAVADKIVCTGYHWGMPGAGTVVKDGNGYALVPVT